VTPAEELILIADQLRVISEVGLSWTRSDHYNRDRYERVRNVAARLFAFADTRAAEEIERTVFLQLTHTAPVPCVDAAVIDEADRILLIQRADDGLWAMPGGGIEMGETAAQAVVRETREEAGLEVDVIDLVGVYDSRFCETKSALQLYQFVFLCERGDAVVATTPHEVLDMGWFDRKELPPLSPGHTVRVPDAFRFLEERRPFFDRV
jgi:mutator protein MutT